MTELTIGQIVSTKQGKKYEVLKFLGEGLTARVYEAAPAGGGPNVALKVLRPGLDEEVNISFRDEAEVISRLRIAESKTDDGLSLIPQIFDRAFDDELEVKFLAMELVKGDSVLDLLEKRPTLPEQMALTIADQAARVLHLLHTDLRRSYTDFQLKNIWWQEAEQRIKLMDWNHVSAPAAEDEAPEGAAADVIRLAAYLYQMLTGKGAMQTGETAQTLAARGGEAWAEDVSAGTRAILIRALHPNPERRFATTDEFRQAIQAQIALWHMSPGDLEDKARRAMRPLRSEERRREPAVVQEANVLVDLLHRRRPDDLSAQWREELDKLTGQISAAWGSGMQFYRVGLFSKALELWPDEAAAWRQPGLWRWVALARQAAADAVAYETHQAEYEAARRRLDEGQWNEAERLMSGLPGGPIDDLAREAAIHRDVLAAEAAEGAFEWPAAAEAYDRADATLAAMTEAGYRRTLIEENGWADLARRAEECRVRGRQTAAETVEVEQLRGDDPPFESLYSRVVTSLKANPTNVALLGFIVEKGGEAALRPEERERLLMAGLTIGVPPEGMRARLTATRAAALDDIQVAEEERRKAEVARQLARQREAQEKRLTDAWRGKRWEEMAVVAAEMGSDALPDNIRRDLLNNFDKAIKNIRPQEAEEVHNVLEAAGVPDMNDRAGQIATARARAGGEALEARLQSIEGLLLAAQYARADSPEALPVAVTAWEKADDELQSLKKQLKGQAGVLDPSRIDALQAQVDAERTLISSALETAEAGRDEDGADDADSEDGVTLYRPRGTKKVTRGGGSPWGRFVDAIKKVLPFLVISGLVMFGIGFLGGRLLPGWPGAPEIVEVTVVATATAMTEILAAITPTTPPLPTPEPTLAPSPTPEPSPTTEPSPTPTPTAVSLSLESLGPTLPTATAAPNATPLPAGATPSSPYFDLPDLGLSAPAGWTFDWAGDSLQLSDDAGDVWTVGIYGARDDQPAEGGPIPSDAVVLADAPNPPAGGATTGSGPAVHLEWARLPDTPPWSSGLYTVTFTLTDEAGQPGPTLGDQLRIEVRPAVPVTIASAETYRELPLMFQVCKVNNRPDATKEHGVEAIGWMENSDQERFLMVREPTSRAIFWLRDSATNDAVLIDDNFLAQLPPVTPPPGTVDDCVDNN